MITTFPQGLRVFLRTTAVDGSLHYLDFAEARAVGSQDPSVPIFSIWNEKKEPLAFFYLNAVSFLVHLPTPIEAPSDAKN